MRTLYIDVYFLINLTVDTLAIYFASKLTCVKITKGKLLLGALVGALCAVITVLLPDIIILKLFASLIGPVVVCLVSAGRISLGRKVRFALAFLVFCALLGGGVNFLFGIFEGLIGDSVAGALEAGVNRRLLLFAIGVLFSIGVFKMIVAFFAGRVGTGCAKVEIEFLGKHYSADALIDSANLATDPMDMSPVMLIKEADARKLIPNEIIELKDPDLLDYEARKRIRLIPISSVGGTKVLVAVRPDRVTLQNKDKKEEIKAVLAIDREGGSFGGYSLLVPASAICDVRK